MCLFTHQDWILASRYSEFLKIPTYPPAERDIYLRSLQLPEIMSCVIRFLCAMGVKVLLTVGGVEAA